MSRLFAVHLLFNEVIVPEQEGNAPYGGDADECVDDAAQNGALSAEKPCDEIKLENAEKQGKELQKQLNEDAKKIVRLETELKDK